MDVIKTIKPHAAGAKRYQQKWNEKLVAVRYRKDRVTGRQYTTVELIVDERMPLHTPDHERPPEFQRDGIAAIRVKFEEEKLRGLIKSQGAKWDKTQKLWHLPLSDVKRMHLEARIVSVNDCYPEGLG